MAAFASAPVTSKNPQLQTSLTDDMNTFLWINDILSMVYNDGNFGYDDAGFLGRTDGLYFPFLDPDDDKTVIYSAGIWLGAKVDGEIRVAVSEYSSEFVPGPMIGGQPQPDEPDFRVYKIGGGMNLNGTPYDDSQDWAEWPVGDGAPVDDYGDPLMLGDQMCWSVYNDADANQHTNMATEPLGVEIQHSTFGFSMHGPYRNIIFLKYTIINKGSDVLDSMYVSLWADPDIGDAGDDFVGSDTALSLGYAYNEGADADYGASPPAVGFDFFQGPLVPSPGDTAFLPYATIPDYKELGMTSFNKYINGTDPQNYLETYNYMRGLNRDGSPIIDPTTLQLTTYFVPGDPVTATGWIDAQSGDRRYMMSSGPFTMAPGDTQIVVAAVLAAQGISALASVTLLKEIDFTAQGLYDANFVMPQPPPVPTSHVTGFSDSFLLIWENDVEGQENYLEDYRLTLNQLYTFEGYNVYIADDPDGPWSKAATFDYDPDEMEAAYAADVGDFVDCEWVPSTETWDCTDAEIGRIWDFARLYADIGLERVIVQRGTNSGISYSVNLDSDPRDGSPFEPFRTYYFAVTAYGVNIQQVNAEDSVFFGQNFAGMLSYSLESETEAHAAMLSEESDSLSKLADHVSGNSDGSVVVEFLELDSITGHDYEVNFNEDRTWNLVDLVTAEQVLVDQENQSCDYDYPVVHGMMVRVCGTVPGVTSIDEYYDINSIIDLHGVQAYMGGRNAIANGNSRDFKIKFLANPWDTVPGPEINGYPTVQYFDENSNVIWGYNIGWDDWPNAADEELFKFSIPFAIYDLGDDFSSTSDDVRLWPLFYDFYGDYRWYLDDYFMFLTRDIGGTTANIYGEDFWSYPPHDGDINYWIYDPGDPYSRHDWDYRSYGFTPYYIYEGWHEGDSIIIITNNANTTEDIFRFSSVLEWVALCGDADGNGDVDIDDAVYLISYIFSDGPAPYPLVAADVDCSGDIDIDDVVYLINYIFADGNAPCDPDGDTAPDCGP
jgi:hypothetical protein